MYSGVRFIFVWAAFLVANLGATTITTTNFTQWSSSSFITGAYTDVLLGAACVGNCPGGSISVSGFTFTGPSLAETSSSPKGLTASTIDIALPAGGYSAVFLDERSGGYNVTLSDGEVFSGLSGLWGFSSPSSITSIRLTQTSGTMTLYALSFATSTLAAPPASETPEAATFLLSAGGLLVLFGCGRKLLPRAPI